LSLKRRDFLAATLTAPLMAQRGAPAAARPNIVLILADDLAAWMLGCYGNREIKTPNIDAFARTGIRFINAFVATPVCSPSRATLFTGRVPRQHGIHDFLTAKPVPTPPQGQEAPPPTFPNEVMISDVLSKAGYECGYVGKWHMGNDQKPGHGYSTAVTMAAGRYQDPVVFRNGERVEEKGYMAEIFTRYANEFLDKQSPAKPFFLTVSYFNPHVPYEGHPQKYYDMYAGTNFDTFGTEPAAPNALREKEYLKDRVGNLRKVAAATTALDDQIPALLRKLAEKQLLGNTLVIFTGDNGFLLGKHGLWSKGHASDPINMYEEVVKVPLLMAWSGKIPAEATTPEMVSFYDVMPTLCDAVGVPVPANRNLSGRSFLYIARRDAVPKGTPPWKNLVFAQMRNTEMARDNRYKLVLRNEGSGPNELFDLTKDAGERMNRYDDPQYVTVRNRLTKELEEWRKRTSA
jgi:arylsulfatase A-like enzyme